MPFEIVPGVTAALGATAYAGIPISHRERSSSIAFVTSTERPGKARSAHDWSHLATATQTLVLYMGVHGLRGDMAALIENGRAPTGTTPTAVIQWGTHPEQRTGTVATIAELCEAAGIGAPAIVVVGEVVSLRESLRWWDARPLFGKHIVVTRAKAQSAGFVDALVDEGASPVEFPVLRFEAPTDGAPLARSVAELASGAYAACVPTSQNGVEHFFAALEARSLDARAFGASKVVAIGPATAESLKVRGVRPDAVAKEFIGEGVARAIGELLVSRFAVRACSSRGPRSRVMRLPKALTELGASVDVVPAYRTASVPTDEVAMLREELTAGRIDAVTLASSSTVTNLLTRSAPMPCNCSLVRPSRRSGP